MTTSALPATTRGAAVATPNGTATRTGTAREVKTASDVSPGDVSLGKVLGVFSTCIGGAGIVGAVLFQIAT